MKITRKLLSYAGPLWLIMSSQVVYAQTAPAAAPATAPNVPAAAPTPADAPAPVSQTPATTTMAPATATPPAAVADANAALPPPAPVALPPVPPPAFEPAPVPLPAVMLEPPAEPLPKKLAVGNSGWLKLGGLFHAWMVVEDNTRAANDAAFYFKMRRAYVSLSGEVIKDTVGYYMLFDAAKALKFTQIPATGAATGYKPSDDGTGLLDLVFTLKSSVVDVSIGQWKSPISYEANSSSSELLLPERAFTTRYFGDNYDAGLKAEKKFDYVKYSLHLLQGTPGGNQIDKNRQKELALRLEFTPMKGIMVGGAGLMSVGQRATQATTRDVVEADVAVDVSDFIARGELLWGWSGLTADNAPDRVKSRGMAASFGYTIAKTIQPVARISYLNVDMTTDGTATSQALYAKFGLATDEVRGYELGVNYLIDGKFAKIQAAYGYFDMDNIDYRHQFILSGQASF